MATTALIPQHKWKGKTVQASVIDILNYAMNPEKTGGGKYVSTYQCQPETAKMEFMTSKRLYQQITGGRYEKQDENVITYMIRQSFLPGEITPEKANEIGYQLAMEFTGGKHQFVVGTHTDHDHIHTHIIFNSTTLECSHKFDNFKDSAFAVQAISDKLCKDNDLSVVEEKIDKTLNHGEWKKEQAKDWPGKLRVMIDKFIPLSTSFDDFLERMEAEGYEIKLGKTLRFRAPGQKRHTIARAATLGADYSLESIKGRITQQQNITAPTPLPAAERTKPPIRIDDKIKKVIDIASKQDKGQAYIDWASIFNMKEASKAINYLSEHNITYQQLSDMVQESAAAFTEVSHKIKGIESRMNEITALRTHIGNYAKTKEVYTQYKKTRRNKDKFYQAHEKEILLHEAAKRAFNALGAKQLPKVAALQAEHKSLKADKQRLYKQYRELKAQMTELQTVKNNIDSPQRGRKGPEVDK